MNMFGFLTPQLMEQALKTFAKVLGKAAKDLKIY